MIYHYNNIIANNFIKYESKFTSNNITNSLQIK